MSLMPSQEKESFIAFDEIHLNLKEKEQGKNFLTSYYYVGFVDLISVKNSNLIQ